MQNTAQQQKETDKQYNMAKSQMHSAKQKLDSKGYKPRDSIYMIFWKRQHYKQIRGG